MKLVDDNMVSQQQKAELGTLVGSQKVIHKGIIKSPIQCGLFRVYWSKLKTEHNNKKWLFCLFVIKK